MADYYPLIAKAVSGLDRSTAETRRALYDRARKALLAQLRGVEPALSETDITRERLALEEAVRKVEADAVQRDGARRARSEPPAPRPAEYRRRDDAAAPAYADAELRETAPAVAADDADAEEGRQTVALSAAATPLRVAETGRAERWGRGSPARPSDGAALRQYSPHDGFGRRYDEDDDDDDRLGSELPRLPPRPPSERADEGRQLQSFPRIVKPERMRASEDEFDAPRKVNRMAAITVIGLLLAGLAGAGYWFSDEVLAIVRDALAVRAPEPAAPPADSELRNGKFSDRAPAPTEAAAGDAGAPAAAQQKVVLYEEDPANPNGTQYSGMASWQTEQVAPTPGQKPDVIIRSEIEIPDQKLSVYLSLRRNDDPQLPASHTVEIRFTLPPDFPHGGIANIPGIMMKQGETTRGVALNGVAVKVTNNYFLVGLSSVEADTQRNVQLLKERSWFDIPVVYSDGKRALIAVEKGLPGERAFSDAFAAWEQ